MTTSGAGRVAVVFDATTWREEVERFDRRSLARQAAELAGREMRERERPFGFVFSPA